MFLWLCHGRDVIRRHLVLTAIILGFLVLSSTGLFYNFGIATAVNDETPPFVAALKMIAGATLRPAYPTFYYLPVAAYAELPFAVLAVVFTGFTVGFGALREFIVLDFAKLLPWARIASMFYGALALILFYKIAQRIFTEKRIALLAVFFFAFSYLFIQLAHFGRVWSVQMLMIILSLWMTLRLLDRPTLGRYLLASLGVVLSFGINMIGALVYAPFVVAHWLHHRGGSFVKTFLRNKNFLLAHLFLCVSVLVFYYLNPYGFENYLGFFKKFFALVGTSSGAAQVLSGAHAQWCGTTLWDGITFYLRVLFNYEFPLVALAILGVFALRHRLEEKRGEIMIVAVFAVAYFIGITAISALGVNTCEPRYILPVVPVLALFGAFGGELLLGKMRKTGRIVFLIFISAAVLYGPVMFDLRLAMPSTRMEAREWILAHIPNQTGIINFEEKLELPEDLATLERIREVIPWRMTVERTYLIEHPQQIGTPAYLVYSPSLGSFGKKEDFQYLVISWWNSKDRMLKLEQAKALGLTGELTRVRRFPGDASDDSRTVDLTNNDGTLWGLWSLKQNGPVVDVYLLRSSERAP